MTSNKVTPTRQCDIKLLELLYREFSPENRLMPGSAAFMHESPISIAKKPFSGLIQGANANLGVGVSLVDEIPPELGHRSLESLDVFTYSALYTSSAGVSRAMMSGETPEGSNEGGRGVCEDMGK